MTISTGIGGGLVLDGRLYRGVAGNAGELGHLTVVYDGRPCGCGRRGCLEAYASGTNIARRAREAIAAGRPSALADLPALTAKDVAEHALDGDPLAKGIWDETMAMLGPVYRAWTRRLYSIQVKGKTTEVELCEVLWRQGADTTALVSNRGPAKARLIVLRLRYRDREVIRRREQDSITIGRDQNAGLVVAEPMASRLHCTIERRQGKFVLADHSTNGTYVTPEGEAEMLLQREEFTLGKHGWIACGQARAATSDLIEYFCD